MIGMGKITAEERAAGLLFREEFRSRDSVEKGGGTIGGTGCTFGPNGMVLDGNGYVTYNTFEATSKLRNSITIRFEFTWGEAINATAQKVFFGSGSLQYLLFKQSSGGNHRLDVYLGGVLLTPIAYATWSAAVVAGRNTFIISGTSGATTVYLNGVVIGTSATAWSLSRSSGLTIGAYPGGSTPAVGTVHAFEIWGNAATAVDEPYLRQKTLISKLDEPLIVLPGKSFYKRAADSKYVTEVQGKAGIREALMGSDGATATQFPSIVKPRGFSFDGGDQINLGDNDQFSFTTGSVDLPFTLAALVRLTNLADYMHIFAKGTTVSTGEYLFYINVTAGTLTMMLTDNTTGGYIYRYTAFNVKPGSDYVFVGTYSGSGLVTGLAIYADGVRVDLASAGAGYTRMRNTALPLTIGSTATYHLNGNVVLPQIFDFELSPMQVKSLTSCLLRLARTP